MITLDSFKASLSKLENGSELLEFFDSSVSDEKTKAIDITRKANKESQNIKKAFNRLGYDGVANVDEFVDVLLETIDGKATTQTTELSDLQNTVKKLQRSFEQVQGELKTEREKSESLHKQNKIKTIEGKLTPKLNEELYGANYLVKSLIAEGALDLDEEGNITLKNGESVLSYDDAIKHLVNSNTDSRKNKQVPGASSSSGVQGKTQYKPKYTMDQIKAMNQEEAAKDIKEVNASAKFYSEKQ